MAEERERDARNSESLKSDPSENARRAEKDSRKDRKKAADVTEANEKMREESGRPRHDPPLGRNPAAETFGSPD